LIVVPLSFGKIGGVSSFIQRVPEHFFAFFNHEYSIGFLIAFAFYNLFYLSGNWAYVQRYTTVKTPKDAKKVGWLFGALYVISPVIWMLPPMIYRIINPDLGHLGAEGAYLLMCKAVLPIGMLGMILGAMIFATSSSVNTTLNISAGVFTNDLYRHFFPSSSEKKLIRVARYSTIFFGIFTIIVALLVPLMGGIVAVVISVGAITGAALFLPPLWCLFSKRQTGRSALTVTIVSLFINLLLKFVAPVFGVSLSRSMEMIVGVGIPIVLLAFYEIGLIVFPRENIVYENYKKLSMIKASGTAEDDLQADTGNRHGKKVISLGVLLISVLVLIIGLASIHTSWVVFITGIIILVLGIFMYPYKGVHGKISDNNIQTKTDKDYVD
jgi:Na+/proline symporter